MSTTASQHMVHTDPIKTVSRSGRQIKLDWLVKEDGDKKHYATLTVSYNLGGMNYFSGGVDPRSYQAGIGRETGETLTTSDGRSLGKSRGFMLFGAIGVLRSKPVARFSKKALESFVPEALARLRELCDEGNPKVLAMFDPDTTDDR